MAGYTGYTGSTSCTVCTGCTGYNISGCLPFTKMFEVVFPLQKCVWSSSLYKNVWGRLPFIKIFEVVFHLKVGHILTGIGIKTSATISLVVLDKERSWVSIAWTNRALYSMYCILCIVFYALYSMHRILCIVFYALYSMHCISCIVLYALYSMHCIICIEFYELYYITFTTLLWCTPLVQVNQASISLFRPYKFHYSNAGLLYYVDQKRILVKLTRPQFVL